MLPTSSLSSAAYGLRQVFIAHIDELDSVANIRIGHPAETIKELEAIGENCLNLFFYNVNYDGYPSDGLSENPFYVRLRCLITAVGQQTTEPEEPGSTTERNVSKGENELRLIGEVMRVLHQRPLLSVTDSNDNEIAQLQIVPYSMDLDNLNHIWSTQNETSYRLSVAYELALAPVPYTVSAETSPMVGDSKMVVWGGMTRQPEREKDGSISLQPSVEYLEIDVGVDDWMPHVCYVDSSVPLEKKLHYVFNVAASDSGAAKDILIAAKDKAKVKLVWNLWRRKTDNSVVVWQEDIADVLQPNEIEIKDLEPPASPPPFHPNRIDPDDIDSRRTFQVQLPAAVDLPDTASWQAVLYAIREWEHEEPRGSGNTITTTIKSNTLLFYGVRP
jgi:hypothetical protein